VTPDRRGSTCSTLRCAFVIHGVEMGEIEAAHAGSPINLYWIGAFTRS
jgi:hypothetical protein